MHAAFVLLTMCCASATTARERATPGVVTQGELSERDFALMQRGGVETLRVLVRWDDVQPSPEGFEWDRFDRLAALASEHDVTLFPFVYGSAGWISDDEARPPVPGADAKEAWSRFLQALVARYGHDGSYVREHRVAPVRMWQIWNEPNFHLYWHPEPSPAAYARLLKISATAIRSSDPRASVVAAGVAPVRGGLPWWEFLRDLYDVRGVRGSVDVMALHPYSPTIADLRAQIELAREIMRENGDGRTSLALTELGWSSGRSRQPMVVGPRRQAKRLSSAFELARQGGYRLSDVLWYAWQDAPSVEPACGFCPKSGLVDRDGSPKPAWKAFRRAARHGGPR